MKESFLNLKVFIDYQIKSFFIQIASEGLIIIWYIKVKKMIYFVTFFFQLLLVRTYL